jgi:2-keto-4-pentenoate hydratase
MRKNDAMTARATAEFLFEARRDRRLLDGLPEDLRPRDVEEAYAVQDALVSLLAEHGSGEPVGFKVGCTNEAAMELLGADHPFWGRLLAENVFESGAQLDLPDAITLGVEPEYAYRVSRAFPARDGGHDAESVLPFLSELIPSIEVVGHRYADFVGTGVPSLVADNALNAAWVAGTPINLGNGAPDLSDVPVEVYVDDVLQAAGNAENVLGHPLNVVAWLVNELADRGRALVPGDYVTTGTCTPLILIAAGSSVRCEFGHLGSVSVGVTA